MDWAPTQSPSSKLIHVPYSGWLPLPSKEFPLYGEQGLKQCQFFFMHKKKQICNNLWKQSLIGTLIIEKKTNEKGEKHSDNTNLQGKKKPFYNCAIPNWHL